MRDRPKTAAILAQLSRDVNAASSVGGVQVVVERAVEVITAGDHCSLTLGRQNGQLRTVASTSEVAVHADVLQYELNQGPCIDAALRDEVCLLDDVRVDTRWPVWSSRIADLGLNSVLSIRLGGPDSQVGALNLFASRPGSFTSDDIDFATAYAAIAGVALYANKEIADLTTALNSRHVIGVAQGILMSRYELDIEQAFSLLRRYSSQTNTKLREVAAYVATHRQLPEDPQKAFGGGDGAPERPHSVD